MSQPKPPTGGDQHTPPARGEKHDRDPSADRPKGLADTDENAAHDGGDGVPATHRGDRDSGRHLNRLTPDPRHIAYPLVLAAGWGWRILVVIAVAALAVLGLQTLSMVVVPLAVALLLTALLRPVMMFLHQRARMSVGLATFVTVIGTIAVVAGLFTFAGTQIASGMQDMLSQAEAGLDKIIQWLHTGPLQLSDDRIKQYQQTIKDAFSGSGSGNWLSRGTEWAASAGHFLAGILIALFATFFFLSQGKQIAVFLISLMPKAAHDPTYQAGRRGWVSLTSYVRVQVIVAAIDAIGIGIGAAILRLPFVIALALLVFITSFIPIVGAIASGAVAVLVALVTHGPVSALVMLGVVLLVQQLESHVLQPFLMGRAVSLHPLAVLLAVVIGSSLMGIVGALFAVPVLAVANSMIRYYHGFDPFPELGAGPLPQDGRPVRPVAGADAADNG